MFNFFKILSHEIHQFNNSLQERPLWPEGLTSEMEALFQSMALFSQPPH